MPSDSSDETEGSAVVGGGDETEGLDCAGAEEEGEIVDGAADDGVAPALVDFDEARNVITKPIAKPRSSETAKIASARRGTRGARFVSGSDANAVGSALSGSPTTLEVALGAGTTAPLHEPPSQ